MAGGLLDELVEGSGRFSGARTATVQADLRGLGRMSYLLDTNTCVYAIKRVPDVIDRLRRLSPDDVSVSSVTLAELWFGARKAASRLARVRAWIPSWTRSRSSLLTAPRRRLRRDTIRAGAVRSTDRRTRPAHRVARKIPSFDGCNAQHERVQSGTGAGGRRLGLTVSCMSSSFELLVGIARRTTPTPST